MTNSLVLDDLDKRILLQLQQNSAITNQELAEKVHASAPTCLRRVRRLTEDGWIQRQVALVQPEKLGMTLTAIVEITLDVQTSEQLAAFEQLVAGEPAIQQCYRVSPGPDFVLVLLVQDMPTMRWRIVCFQPAQYPECAQFLFRPPQQIRYNSPFTLIRACRQRFSYQRGLLPLSTSGL
jgi:Lrp/AsnC family leucine-responsive transcriptional regulator